MCECRHADTRQESFRAGDAVLQRTEQRLLHGRRRDVACVDHLASNASVFYPRMDAYARTIATHVCDVAAHAGAAVAANCVGPCVQLFAGANSIPTLAALERVDKDATLRLTELLVRNGVSPLPRGLMYLSTAHDDEDIDLTLRALRVAIETFARESAGARR